MKKILVFLCTALLLFVGCGKEKFDETNLYGTWKSGTLYYKYMSSGSGYTWDTADDVDESEAQSFTWEMEGDQLTQYHQMENSSGVIPKLYTIKTLTATTLTYTSNGKTETFTKQ